MPQTSPPYALEAITVGAIDKNGKIASFSNNGPCVDIYAPGVGIVSASSTSYTGTCVMSGTSMAVPHVTGLVACLLGAYPTTTPRNMVAILQHLCAIYGLSRGLGEYDLIVLTFILIIAYPQEMIVRINLLVWILPSPLFQFAFLSRSYSFLLNLPNFFGSLSSPFFTFSRTPHEIIQYKTLCLNGMYDFRGYIIAICKCQK